MGWARREGKEGGKGGGGGNDLQMDVSTLLLHLLTPTRAGGLMEISGKRWQCQYTAVAAFCEDVDEVGFWCARDSEYSVWIWPTSFSSRNR